MTLRIGLIGLGKITTRFARVLNTMDKVEIAAVASRDLSRSKKFAQEFNAKTVCTKYEEVIQSKDVDQINIGSRWFSTAQGQKPPFLLQPA